MPCRLGAQVAHVCLEPRTEVTKMVSVFICSLLSEDLSEAIALNAAVSSIHFLRGGVGVHLQLSTSARNSGTSVTSELRGLASLSVPGLPVTSWLPLSAPALPRGGPQDSCSEGQLRWPVAALSLGASP